MKKTMITLFTLLSLAGQAQILNVSSIEKLTVPNEEKRINQALAISPRGDYLLLSSDAREGLVKLDIATGKSTVLETESVNGSDITISDDGNQVTFEQVSYQDRHRHETVKSINLTTGKQQTVSGPKHKAQSPSLSTDQLSSQQPVLSHHHLKLYITRNGETRLLAPNGENERYIWSSLSPDGSKVLYYVSGQGAFVCDLDGNHVTGLGNITAPKWWDDNTVVGMHEVDGEYTVISSSIVVRTLDGVEQVITGDDVIATYPLPCRQVNKIAFSTPDGGIYLIDVRD